MYDEYNNISHFQSTNWIDFYILISDLSKAIRHKSVNVEVLLIETFFHILCFAKQNDIDLRNSWERWKI